jgi:hypothetical protein
LFYFFKLITKQKIKKQIKPVASCLLLSACVVKPARESSVQKPRAGEGNFFPFTDSEIPVPRLSDNELLEEAFGFPFAPFENSEISACDYLDLLPVAQGDQPKFRIVDLPEKDIFTAVKAFDKKSEQSFLTVTTRGRVDISASPLFQYAIFLETIPTREDFFSLVQGQKSWEGFNVLKALLTHYKGEVDFFLKSFGTDPNQVSEENFTSFRDIVLSKTLMNYMPGVLDRKAKYYALYDSLPDIVIHNGMPSLFKGLNEVAPESLSVHENDLRPLAQNRSLFRSENWSDFSNDIELSMNLSLKAMRSQNPKEEGCATYLMHRAFSQLIRLKGFDQPPLSEIERYGSKNSDTATSLPNLKNLISSEGGVPAVKACARPGPFSSPDNLRLILTEEHLSDPTFALKISKKLNFEPECRLEDSRSSKSADYLKTYKNFPLKEQGNFDDWAHFISGVVHFVTAYNPAVSWWQNKDSHISYPLVGLNKLSHIKEVGGILPLETHQLAAGLTLAGAFALQNHIVLLDKNLKVTSQLGDVFSIRISKTPFILGETKKIQTDLESLMLVTEALFKIHPEIELLAEWNKKIQESSLDPKQKPFIHDFVVGAFKSEDHLNQVLELFYKPLAPYAHDFKYALAYLASQYAKPLSNASHSKGYTCYSSFEMNLDNNSQELKTGECSLELRKKWKRLMNWSGRYFQSPVFYSLSQSIRTD